jgi:hypothetical protein
LADVTVVPCRCKAMEESLYVGFQGCLLVVHVEPSQR